MENPDRRPPAPAARAPAAPRTGFARSAAQAQVLLLLTLLVLLKGLGPARAADCDIALILAVDVSGSIDSAEYRMQADGMAVALADPQVAAALVGARAAVLVLQWSSIGQQQVMIPWRRMTEPADVTRIAAEAARMPRAFTLSDTAPGEMIAMLPGLFDRGPACLRRVTDISGDGPINAGLSVTIAGSLAWKHGITLNALAIEDPGAGIPITEFYRRAVITPDGFVITARGLADYPRALRAKLLRELAVPTG